MSAFLTAPTGQKYLSGWPKLELMKHYCVVLEGPHFDMVNVWPGEFDQGKDPDTLGIQAVDVKWRVFDYRRCVEVNLADADLITEE